MGRDRCALLPLSLLLHCTLSFSVCHDVPHPRRTTHAHKLLQHSLCRFAHSHRNILTHSLTHSLTHVPLRAIGSCHAHPRTQAVLRYTIQAKNARGKALALIIDQVTTLIHCASSTKIHPFPHSFTCTHRPLTTRLPFASPTTWHWHASTHPHAHAHANAPTRAHLAL